MDRSTLLRILGDKANDSTLRKIGKEALKTAVNTLIEEGIEAAVEIWKKRRLKIQEEFLEKHGAPGGEGSEMSEDRERKEYPEGGGDAGDETPVDEPPEEGDRAAGEERRSRSSRAGIESFGSYTSKKG